MLWCACVCVYVCLSVCVRVGQTERESLNDLKNMIHNIQFSVSAVSVCVCVCVRWVRTPQENAKKRRKKMLCKQPPAFHHSLSIPNTLRETHLYTHFHFDSHTYTHIHHCESCKSFKPKNLKHWNCPNSTTPYVEQSTGKGDAHIIIIIIIINFIIIIYIIYMWFVLLAS